MKMSFRTLAAFCTLALAVNTGCSDNSGSSSENNVTPLMNSGTSETSSSVSIIPENTDEGDYIPAQTADTNITFGTNGVQISGNGANDVGNVVTISKSGVYGISGECSDGKIIVDTDKDSEVTLLLNGIKLTSGTGSVIDCEKAAKLIITSSNGTENVLSDTENYVFADNEDEPDAAVFSRCDTVFNGLGSITVNGLYKDGIKCKDGLKICGGKITVNSADDGITGKDYLIVADGTITVAGGGDGLKSSNDTDTALGYINITGGSIDITSDNDAMQAETEIIIHDGSIKAVSGGGSATVEYTSSSGNFGGGWGDKFSMKGSKPFDFDSMTDEEDSSVESMKGLKAGTAITISGGTIDIDSADDSVHSNGTLLIDGGELNLSSGDDGLHADGNLTVNDGSIYISTSYEGIEGMSIDINGGSIELYSYDDGLNAAGGDNGAALGFGSASSEYYISISGGNVTVNADGDGLDSNGTMAMSGGTVVVFGPSDGENSALDYENSFAVSGGTLIAFGSTGMAQAPSTLSQPCISINASVSAGAAVEVQDADGNTVLGVETPKSCQSLIFTSDKFTEGEEYSVYADNTLLATVTAENGVSGGGGMGGAGGFGRDNMNGGKNNRDDWVSTDTLPDMPQGGFEPDNRGQHGGSPADVTPSI